MAGILSAVGICDNTVLSPAGPVAAAERAIALDSLAIMLAIVIPTLGAILWFAWWFRARNTRASYTPDWAYSGRLELLVWSVPALVVLFLGGIAWIGSHKLDPAVPLAARPRPLEVDVVSLDWKWLFIYPQQRVASVNRLVVPVGVPLYLRVTSATVMNVFFVPRLGSQIYSMNGMATRLNLQVDVPGVYPGLSANFSGDGFADMAFGVQAVAAADFAAWSAAARRSGDPLDDQSYRQLLHQTQNVTPYTYRDVQPGIFARIVAQQLPPGDGPAAQSNTDSQSLPVRGN